MVFPRFRFWGPIRQTRKVWIYRYKRDGREIKLGLGRYPIISHAAARRKAREEMKRREDGIDSQKARRKKREEEQAARLNTFELVARKWHKASAKDRQRSVDYAEKIIRYLAPPQRARQSRNRYAGYPLKNRRRFNLVSARGNDEHDSGKVRCDSRSGIRSREFANENTFHAGT